MDETQGGDVTCLRPEGKSRGSTAQDVVFVFSTGPSKEVFVDKYGSTSLAPEVLTLNPTVNMGRGECL